MAEFEAEAWAKSTLTRKKLGHRAPRNTGVAEATGAHDY